MKGWISIHRSIKDHWLYPKGRPFTKYEAWITILLEVNHTDVKELKGFNLIECKRGESIKSLDTWSKMFNWTKSKVRRFFILLEKDSMIVTTNAIKTTHLKVLNYDSYQDARNKIETKVKRKRNDTETKLTPNNNGNNLNNENNLKESDLFLKIEISDKLKTKILEFFTYRNELKKPYKSDRSKLALIKKMLKVNEKTAIAQINQTIENGWQGIFELKTNGQDKPTPEKLEIKWVSKEIRK